MLLRDIVFKIEQRIMLPNAEDFDNVGLLCGSPEREISGILVCHDALEAVVEEAARRGANMVVCFHPIIFSGLKSITDKNYVERAVLRAIEEKIAIYAVHTAWDNDYFGVNHRICEVLGLKNQKILLPKKNNLLQLAVFVPTEAVEAVKEAAFAAGAGQIGFYDECSFAVPGRGSFRPLPGSDPYSGSLMERENTDEQLLYFIFEKFKKDRILASVFDAHPYEEVAYQVYPLENENQYAGLGRFGDLPEDMDAYGFLSLLKEKFNLKTIRHSQVLPKHIRKVGVLGGSGAEGISAALRAGCDAYVTADLKYHDFFRAEGKIFLCDIGHFESEQFVAEQLCEALSEIFPKFAILKSETDTNPVNYFT